MMTLEEVEGYPSFWYWSAIAKYQISEKIIDFF